MSRMSDDFRDLNLDKPARRELKTVEQINKHTVEGFLENRSVDRALHLLTVGDELQKISVMKNLPTLIKDDLTSCIQRIIPRMQQTLPHGTTEYNMGACEAVRTVAQQNLMSSENFSKVFLQHIINSLESRDTVAADEWLNTLLDIIQALPIPVLQNDVLPIAVNKAHISKPVPVRITSCRILGRLSLSFSPFLVKKDIIPVVISLCQDVSGDVRAAMSAELPNVSATLGLETGTYLLNHVLDLVSDEEQMVRDAAIQALAQMLPRFTPEVLKSTIIPLTKKVFQEIMKNEDKLLIVLSKFYGQYAIGMKGVMTMAEKGQFLQRYIQLSQLNSNNRRRLNPYKPIVMDEDELALRLTECRLHCAYNYPAMVLFCSEFKADLDALYGALKALASDSYCNVRRKIAAGFYEVMKIMPKWHALLKAEFIKLLKDDIDIVLEGIVPNLANILLTFSASNTIPSDKVDSGRDVGQAIFVCEKNLSEAPQWRLHEEFLLALRVVPKVFHPEFVSTYFVPHLMLRATSLRILPCRLAALHVVLVILADPSQTKQKLKIRNKILELCNSSSFHCRLLFLRGMNILVTLAPEILKELFLHNITTMADDKVANIRLVVCRMLPSLKALALDPLDRKLLASVDAALTTLSGETDRDVLAQMQRNSQQMDDLERTKGAKKIGEPASISFTSIPKTNQSPPKVPNFAPLTDMRSFTYPSESAMPRPAVSQYSVANVQKSPGMRPRATQGTTGRTQSMTVTKAADSRTTTVSSTTSSRVPTPKMTRANTRSSSDDKKKHFAQKLSADEFLVDTGISLKSMTSATKRVLTPRPVHKHIISQNTDELGEQSDNVEQSLSIPRNSWTLSNKNLNIRGSSLPVKKYNPKSLTDEEIEKELTHTNSDRQYSPRIPKRYVPMVKTSTQSLTINEEQEKELLLEDSIRPYSPRMSGRLKYQAATTKSGKKENKRYSLDVGNITNNYSKMETRSININKRYSLNVDGKQEIENKKGLSCSNNNTMMSPKLVSTRSGIVRPQSCVLRSEKVTNSKRSMSVENLPPKLTRLTSRLPVRATDSKKQ